MAAAKKSASGRVCGYCSKGGHNSRTCEVRKANEATADDVIPVDGAEPEGAAASAAMVHVASDTPPGAVVVPAEVGLTEFQEIVRQVQVNGNTIRISMREYDGGISTGVLRFATAAGGTKDIALDFESMVKTLELLSWALQSTAARHAGGAKPTGKALSNGKAVATAATAG